MNAGKEKNQEKMKREVFDSGYALKALDKK